MTPVEMDPAGAVCFFDLSGTLAEPEREISRTGVEILHLLAGVAKEIVLVTSQPSDDPQVMATLRVLADLLVETVAYVTRGGRRLRRPPEKREYVVDNGYESGLVLSGFEIQEIEGAVERALKVCDTTLLIPVRCLDDVVMRANVDARIRPRMAAAIKKMLPDFSVIMEGRTSIFISSGDLGKQNAVSNEMKDHDGPAYYFGNEVAYGNDRDVLGIEGLTVFALGGVGERVDGAVCRNIGDTPDDMYSFLKNVLGA